MGVSAHDRETTRTTQPTQEKPQHMTSLDDITTMAKQSQQRSNQRRNTQRDQQANRTANTHGIIIGLIIAATLYTTHLITGGV